ncbi:MAG: DNA alkylation repair protein [Muribaculaceae bacterium]|nr:DNA alkylation repair protein [Muribaculaceae bacterium]
MLQSLKKEFFAHRNGMLAQQLKNAGDQHAIIMGCQLVDIIAITSRYCKDSQLAQALWSEIQLRECRMAAPMLFPVDEFTMGNALDWCNSVESTEIADVLCHRLLRHLPFANQLWETLSYSDHPLPRYTAWRLLLNLLLMNKIENPANLLPRVEQELQSAPPHLKPLLQSIKEECLMALKT